MLMFLNRDLCVKKEDCSLFASIIPGVFFLPHTQIHKRTLLQSSDVKDPLFPLHLLLSLSYYHFHINHVCSCTVTRCREMKNHDHFFFFFFSVVSWVLLSTLTSTILPYSKLPPENHPKFSQLPPSDEKTSIHSIFPILTHQLSQAPSTRTKESKTR